MTRRLVVRRIAERELGEAARYYDGLGTPGLANELLDEFEQTAERIRRNAEAFQVARNDIRRARLKRFPYGVYFRVLGSRVIVIGVIHLRRDPAAWWSR